MNHFFTNPEILDLLHDSVIATDLNGIVTHCNSAAERIYEYSREELVGSSVAILYPHDQLPRMQELIAKVHSTGKADGRFLNRTKSGREIWIHLSVSLLMTDQSGPKGMIGFSIDITAQIEAEQARQRIEELNRAASAAAGVGAWSLGLKDGTLYWDDQSRLLMDMPADVTPTYELFLSCVHPEDRPSVTRLVQECLETGAPYYAEFRVQKRDGSLRWVTGRGQITRDENNVPVRLLGVAIDITARKEAEEELQKSQAKYRVLFDSPHIGVASANIERFTDANETYCRMIGHSREALLSGAVRWQDVTPEEYLERDYACLQEMLNTGVGTPFEKDYIRSDGSRIRVLLGASILSRDPLEWSCFVLDITQQHRALSALRQAEQITAAAKLGSALAHEINNPLTSLTNVLYLLRSGDEGLPRNELLLSAQDSLDRITRITRQMIGLWTASDTISEFKIGQVLEDTVATYASRTRAKELRVESRNELANHAVSGVEGDLRRLMSSLVENAVENTPPGGTIRIHVRRAREWRMQSSGIAIVVCDNGPGIARDRLPNLFEPFVSTKEIRGSGLGLWASRGIAEKHGGRVTVRTSTRPGASGTCVAVFLPQHAEKDAAGA